MTRRVHCRVARCEGVRLGTFETTATQVGSQVNLVNSKADQRDLSRQTTPPRPSSRSKALPSRSSSRCSSASSSCERQAPRPLRLLELGRVDRRDPPRGSQQVRPAAARSRPARPVRTGRNIDAFQVEFARDAHVDARSRRVAASASTSPCTATIRIDKTLDPANDSAGSTSRSTAASPAAGRTSATRGRRATSLVAALPAGSSHTVGERPARDERGKLRHHDRLPERRWRRCGAGLLEQRRCRGHRGAGRRRRLHDRQHAERRDDSTDAADADSSRPRASAASAATAADTPTGSTARSTDTTGSARTRDHESRESEPITIGSTYRVTIRVTNNGGAAATNVTVTELISLGTALLSVTPSQGRCSAAARSCNLGTLRRGPRRRSRGSSADVWSGRA